MAKTEPKNNVASATTVTTTYSIDRCGCCIALTTVFVILIVVITGVCIRFLVDNPLSSIILICLIVFLCILGVIALTTLEVRRRKANNVKTVTMRNGNTYYNIQPTAPHEDTSWNYSNRKTLPA